MKYIIKLFVALFLFTINSCKAQQMIKNENDAKKIIANKSTFINKPLSYLLKEIKPQIKRVTAHHRADNIQECSGYFIFNFIDDDQKNRMRIKDSIPVTIVVYVKEPFDWDYQKRTKGKATVWTKNDVAKYGNLTIVGFRVYGNSTSN